MDHISGRLEEKRVVAFGGLAGFVRVGTGEGEGERDG